MADQSVTLEAVADGVPWAIPHRDVYRLSEARTAQVVAGANPADVNPKHLAEPAYRGFAGGGIVGGKAIGATDEIGLRAVEDKVHMHDAHATILSLLGLDHRRLTYLHQGRAQRLTDVGGDNDLAARLLKA